MTFDIPTIEMPDSSVEKPEVIQEEVKVETPISTIEEPIKKEEEEVVIPEQVKPAAETEKNEDSADDSKKPMENAESQVIYDLMTESGVMLKEDGFTPTPESIQKKLEALPQAYFDAAVSNLHPDAQQLLQLAFQLKDGASKDKLSEYFAQIPDTIDVSTEDNAYNYLKGKFADNPLFSTPEALERHLDGLTSEQIMNMAKSMSDKDVSEKSSALEAETARIAAERAATKQKQIEFHGNVMKELEATKWSARKQRQVQEALSPEKTQAITKAISSSPKAMIQFGDLLTKFNIEKGEFIMDAPTDDSVIKKAIETDAFKSLTSSSKTKAPKASSDKIVYTPIRN